MIAIARSRHRLGGEGIDERFSGYGGEDDAIVAAAECLAKLRRDPQGLALSLFHADANRDIGSERHRPNMELAMRYIGARKSKKAMMRLIEERDY